MPLCCIDNCGVGSSKKKPGHRNYHLFNIPTQLNRKQQWLEAIEPHLRIIRRRRSLSESWTNELHVCELHFELNDIERDYKTLLKDGSVYSMPRGRYKLKNTSVPSIFNKSQLTSQAENKENVEPNSVIEIVVKDVHLSGQSSADNNQHSSSSALVVNLDSYNLEALMSDIRTFSNKIPDCWGFCEMSNAVLLFCHNDEETLLDRTIFIRENMTTEIRANGNISNVELMRTVTKFDDVLAAMLEISKFYICRGNSINNSHFTSRFDVVDGRCMSCLVKDKEGKDRNYQKLKRTILKKKQMQSKLKNWKRKYNRLQEKITKLERNNQNLQLRWATASKNAVEEAIINLPKTQQEAIRACLMAAKCKGPTGRRYSNSWILECLLIRIKSRRTYIHLRNHKILTLPTIETLCKYIRNLKPSYGFDEELFKTLSKKALHMNMEDRRGQLVVDELKLSESVSFDKETYKFVGFTDLGDHTPEHQKNVRGDHGLVFLFQPFRGKWLQTVGAFLSKGCASGTVLHKLILECVLLLENAGFFVDVVTSDGATWNRTMWKHFGLGPSDVSCVHPSIVNDHENDNNSEQSVDQRRLWFCSDFSHLAKNFRNFFTASDETWTPDGIVKLNHFYAVIDCDGGTKHFGLKIAYKLTHNHIKPKYFQKMNVGMAFQLFAPQVSAAMETYKDKIKDLEDCASTVNFIKRFNKVIEAMTSRCPKGALAFNTESYKTIIDFRNYLEDWQDKATENNFRFMSSSTYNGFLVTLRTVIEVMTFLTEDCNYKYFMTSRLNQDALEGFFGMVRSSCGSSDHPDSLQFIQVYRLLSFYSIVKPPRGSNVESVDLFETILSSNDIAMSDCKKELMETLDKIYKRGASNAREYDVRDNHDYNTIVANEFVQAYFAGFVAFKIKKWTKCTLCLSTTYKVKGDCPRDDLINKLSEGYLTYPSDNLFNLLNGIENAILKTTAHEELNCYSFLHIAQNILLENLSFIGCPEHMEELTKNVINYYAVSRAHILSKAYNKMYCSKKEKEQEHRKRVKLVAGTSHEK